MTEACPDALVGALLKGEVDLCLITGPASLPDRMNRWALFVDAVVLLAPEAAGDVILEDVQSGAVNWIRAHDMVTLCEPVSRTLPRARHEVASRRQAAILARAGLGVMFSTLLALPEPGLTRHSLEWQKEHDVLLVSVAGRPLHRLADAFLKLARARAWHPPEQRSHKASLLRQSSEN